MSLRLPVVILAFVALTALPPDSLTAQDHAGMDHAAHMGAPAATNDSAFRALQERGKGTMGVDQYASRHRFEDLADGGRIELQMREADSAGIAAIRAHLQQTARDFAAGIFTAPDSTHAMVVPGTEVMARKKGRITYRYRPLPQGGEVRITTRDAEALRAIREFLAFQREDHRTTP
ncbi:MAG TPA: hypothetical protein VFI13_00915 [Gemmatimonadales bacterium]|nr:hypothetical protein [Gemmatimonadales bacterium]